MNISEIIRATLEAGESNAVSVAELCRITGLQDRELRAAIAAERSHGSVICSNAKGYFLPGNRSELQAFIRQERARASSIKAGLRAAEQLLKEWRGEKPNE